MQQVWTRRRSLNLRRTSENNLYKIWNRMSSGSYIPPPVRTVAIPKKSGGGERMLGIPTVSDRVAQTVGKLYFEPMVEPHFHEDSYGYRPGKSALDAVEVTRKRCWKYDWVLEFDIKGLFDNIDYELLMKTVRWHTKNRWLLLYIERWLKAPFQKDDGTLVERTKGTPQGGVVSPVLANLFLHYVFDLWMKRNYPALPFCRYADDGIVHCRTEVGGPCVEEGVGGQIQGVQAGTPPGEDQGRLLQELQPQKGLSCGELRLSRVYVSPEVREEPTGNLLRRLCTRSEHRSRKGDAATEPAMESAAAKRSVPGRGIKEIQPHHQGLDQLLCALLQVCPVSDLASPERAPRQVGNEEVQKVAVPSHQSGVMAGGNCQKATRAVSALAVWRTTDGWMMGAR